MKRWLIKSLILGGGARGGAAGGGTRLMFALVI